MEDENANSSAGSQSADSRRTERVACFNDTLQHLWSAARAQDEGRWQQAADEIAKAEKRVREAKAACERERRGKEVHGKNPEAP